MSAVVILLAFTPGCRILPGAGDYSADGPSGVSVSGKVLKPGPDSVVAGIRAKVAAADLSGFVAAPDADVWIEELAADLRYHTTSDASGSYVINNVPPGVYHVITSFRDTDGVIRKCRSAELKVTETPEGFKVPDMGATTATNIVTVRLRDTEGKFLPPDTAVTLWGERFVAGEDGFFTSPPLPDSYSEAEIFVQLPGGKGVSSFNAPFVSADVPAFMELTLGADPKTGNNAPSATLKAYSGTELVSKTSSGAILTLVALGADADSGDQAALIATWSATAGTLSDGASAFEKRWTAPTFAGMATITVEVKDPKGATGTARLPVLIDIDNPSQVDSGRPTVTLSTEVAQSTDSQPFVVSITFNEPVTGFAIEDVSVTNGSMSDLTTLTASRVFTVKVTPAAAGAVTVTVPENVVIDAAGNKNTAANIITVTNSMTPTLNSAKAISVLKFTAADNPALGADVTGTITGTDITVIMPFGMARTVLKPTITHSGASLSPASGVANDFTSTVTYIVTANDGSTRAYLVTVTNAANPAKIITATTVGTLVGGNITAVPAATKVSDFKSGLTVSANATVEILAGTGGAAVADQATTAVTSAMVIKVTAQDLTSAEYTIALGSSDKAITATSIGTLTGGNITTVPAATKVSAFKSGLTVSANATVEILASAGGSAVTNQTTTDVTAAMVIKVTAQDLTSAEYTITLGSSDKAITATTVGTLVGGNITAVPAATKVSVFKSGLTVSVNATVEILASTGGAAVANQTTTDVTAAMVIKVTAQDLTSAEYTITLGSSDKAITATTVGTLVGGNITAVPAATKVSDFKSGLTVSANATVEILASAGGSAVTNQTTTDVASTMVIKVTAQDLTSAEYTIALGSPAKIIIATTLGTLVGGNITAVPAATKVSVFKSGLTVSANATVEILASAGGAAVANQTTTAVTSAMVIKVTAQDLTSAEYTITLGSPAKIITATTVGTLVGGNITAVPAATKVSVFKSGLTVSVNATVEILVGAGGVAVADQTTTDVTAAMVIKVTAQDLTSAEYTITMDYISITLKAVPAGTFQRDADSANTSTVSAFRMSQYEITRAQFLAIMGTDPSDTGYSSGVTDPVQTVNWYHAIAFCNKLSLAEGLTPAYSVSGVDFSSLTFTNIPTSTNNDWNAATCDWGADGYRLPTEMEWMWAAMGANKDSQPGAMSGGINVSGYGKAFAGSDGSNSIGDYAWYGYDYAGSAIAKRTDAVGNGRNANELGLYDMSGNAWEWCWDWYAPYPASVQSDYKGAGSSSNRVARGGSFGNSADYVPVAYRSSSSPDNRSAYIGFRVVCP